MINAKIALLLSIVFAFLWSTGFIVGRLIVDTISPNLYLGIRFFLATLLFAGLTYHYKHSYPKQGEFFKHILIGILCNGFFLGGGYWAVDNGMPASIMTLFGGLQPLFTLIVVSLFFKEKFSLTALIGIIVGLIGVYLALPPSEPNHQSYSVSVLIVSILSIVSITIGVIFQKYYVKPSPLLPSLTLQNMAGTVTAFLLVMLLKENTLIINTELFIAFFWGVFILSGVNIYLLFYLNEKIGSVKTTALLLICPPLAGVQAKLLFDESLTTLQMIGFGIALVGVAISQRPQKSPKPQ